MTDVCDPQRFGAFNIVPNDKAGMDVEEAAAQAEGEMVFTMTCIHEEQHYGDMLDELVRVYDIVKERYPDIIREAKSQVYPR